MPHRLYLALEANAAEWQRAYRELFRNELEPGMVDAIRRATHGNCALGDERFAQQMTTALGRRVVSEKAGCPRKLPKLEAGNLFG